MPYQDVVEIGEGGTIYLIHSGAKNFDLCFRCVAFLLRVTDKDPKEVKATAVSPNIRIGGGNKS